MQYCPMVQGKQFKKLQRCFNNQIRLSRFS